MKLSFSFPCSKDVRLPVQLQRAMAAEAEAAREARAKVRCPSVKMTWCKWDSNVFFLQVIAAEGEQKASRALREAANVIAESSSALQVHIRSFSLSSSFIVAFGCSFSINARQTTQSYINFTCPVKSLDFFTFLSNLISKSFEVRASYVLGFANQVHQC